LTDWWSWNSDDDDNGDDDDDEVDDDDNGDDDDVNDVWKMILSFYNSLTNYLYLISIAYIFG
jgi:hypothetical protein